MANKPLKSLTFPDLADTYTIPTKVSDLTNDAGYVPFESIATAYSTSATYAVGDYVWYSGQLYRCTTAITTAESWTAAHWAAVKLAGDVGELKSALKSGDEEDAIYHLGFYLDENGDLCQVEEGTNNG